MATGPRISSLSSDPEAAYSFGRYLQNQGKHGLALREMAKAVQADPAHAQAYNAMGVSYDVLGEHERAEACYQSALRQDSDLAWVHNNLGVSFLMQDRAREALEPLSRAVELKPETARYRNNLGLAYLRSDRIDEALIQFEMANGEARAHRMLAGHFQRRGKEKIAREYLERAEIYESLTEADKPGKSGRAKTGTKMPDETPVPVSSRYTYRSAIDTEYYLSADRGRREPYRENDEFQDPETQRASFSGRVESERNPDSEATKNPSPVPPSHPKRYIEISNGNGVRGMAAKVKAYLNSKDFDVTRLTNANHFGHDRTVIYYRPEHETEAHRIDRHIPGKQVLHRVERLDWESIKIKVLIGRDIVSRAGSRFSVI